MCFQIFGPLGAEYRHFFGGQSDKGEVIPKLGVTGRQILEIVGTDGFRAAYPDVWLKLAMVPRYEDERIVIDDVRYENEAEAIRKRGGVLLHIERGGHEPERTGHKSDEGIVQLPEDIAAFAKDGDVGGLQSAVQFVIASEALCSTT